MCFTIHGHGNDLAVDMEQIRAVHAQPGKCVWIPPAGDWCRGAVELVHASLDVSFAVFLARGQYKCMPQNALFVRAV